MADKITSPIITTHISPQAPEKAKAEKPAEPKEQADISPQEDQKSDQPKPGRRFRKNFARATGYLFGALKAVKNIPLGVSEGIDHALHPDKDITVRKRRIAKLSTLTATAAGAVVGTAVFGPVGLIVGSTAGYISSVIGNFLDNRAGATDAMIDNIDKNVDEEIDKLPQKEDSSKFRKALNAGVKGARAAASSGWKSGKVIGSGTGAGLISGASFIAKEIKEDAEAEKARLAEAKNAEPTISPEKKSLANRVLRAATGAVCGISGILMNVPGGAVEGSLEAVESGFHRKEITRPLLLFATNAGKVLPPALAGAAIGGPAGAAIGTAVGLISASLTTVIDGKYGFNKGIIRKIDKAAGEVNDDTKGRSEGFNIYHKAARTSLVGAYAGLKEGWSLGYKGGTEFYDGLFETPIEAAKHEDSPKGQEESPKLRPGKQMEFEFMKEKKGSEPTRQQE